jgi:hypothetical protein
VDEESERVSAEFEPLHDAKLTAAMATAIGIIIFFIVLDLCEQGAAIIIPLIDYALN